MSSQAAAHANLHAMKRARLIDGVLATSAAACWIAFSYTGADLSSYALLAAAAGLTTLTMFRPWCRHLSRRSIEATTWALERERGHALQIAAQHAEAWRAIVVTANEGIVTIDARGTIETANAAAEELFGYRHQELVGKNVKLLMPEPYTSEHDGYLERYLRTGERRIIGIGREVVGRRKDGSTFPIDLSVGEGTIDDRPFFTAIMRDISERKELQTKLAQTERLAAVGELAAGVAHEINNPINTMINCAQLISDGDDPAENSRVVVEEGQRIADIVRDLLQFARDDRDQAQPTSVSEAVQRTQRLIGENWKRHGIKLEITVPSDLPNVQARPQQIQQVLLNLLLNAKEALVQADAPDRQVSLRAEARDGGVLCEVADNGPGVEPTVADRLFEPFVTTKRARGGSGLGLSISNSIIKNYSGTLRHAPNDSGGATFSFWLPAASCEPSA